MGALILLIIIAVPMILSIINLIKERSRGIFDDDSWSILLIYAIVFLFGGLFLVPCLIMGYQPVDTEKYDRILRDIEYSTTYSIDTEERIIDWNSNVNDWNNKDEMVIYIITDIEYTHNKITKVKVVKRTDYLFGNIINS